MSDSAPPNRCPFVVMPLPDGKFQFTCPRPGCRAVRVGPHMTYYRRCEDGESARGGICEHRGDVLRVEQCKSCGGNVRFKVFACEIHKECTLADRLSVVKSCVGCAEYEPKKKG